MTAKSRRDTAAYIKGLEEKSRKEQAIRAAAPDMLDALKRVIEWMDDNGYRPDDQSFGARAAMAKAEGRLR